MKERPILFSGPMVRAILDGRKTQTRRVVNPQPEHRWNVEPDGTFCRGEHEKGEPCEAHTERLPCPYGAPGDRLWVRECHYMTMLLHDEKAGVVEYRADYHDELADGIAWKPSIHMPRWASRITLEVVSVRVERLNEISEGDAIAEGCSFVPGQGTIPGHYLGGVHPIKGNRKTFPIPMQAYRSLWQSINGPESWAENPWVWVVEFKRVEGGEK